MEFMNLFIFSVFLNKSRLVSYFQYVICTVKEKLISVPLVLSSAILQNHSLDYTAIATLYFGIMAEFRTKPPYSVEYRRWVGNKSA